MLKEAGAAGASWGRDDTLRQLEVRPRFGEYVVEGTLGRGGMGEVFRARSADGEEVALKVMAATLTAEEDRARFEQEARVLSRLDDPSVVRLHDCGVDARTDLPYLVMELVEGRDLDRVLRDRGEPALTVQEAVHVLEGCARALEVAHGEGILHRDVKPGNLLVTSQGEVKLGDFGIALPLDASCRLTAAGELVGTPWFMAPEVVRGAPWSPAADCYALGALAHRGQGGRHVLPRRRDHAGHGADPGPGPGRRARVPRGGRAPAQLPRPAGGVPPARGQLRQGAALQDFG